MGQDFGALEFIPNCTPLRDIKSLVTKLIQTANEKKVSIDNVLNNDVSIEELANTNTTNNYKLNNDLLSNLIASAAGSYVAAYVMGIGDR